MEKLTAVVLNKEATHLCEAFDKGTPLDSLESLAALVSNLQADELVFVLDDSQIWIYNQLNNLEEVFISLQCDILFAASASFIYDDIRLQYYFWKFYPRAQTGWAYADGSAFVGQAGKIEALLQLSAAENLSYISFRDLFTQLYVHYLLGVVQTELVIKLDIRQQLFGDASSQTSTFKWPMFSWIQRELFECLESRRFSQTGKRFTRDRHRGIACLQQEECAVSVAQRTKPAIWLLPRGNGCYERVLARLRNEAMPNRLLIDWIRSLVAYVASLYAFMLVLIINKGTTQPARIFRYSIHKNPEWMLAMNAFLSHLAEEEPFAFSHFNDGELTFIKKYLNEDHTEVWFGRKQQKYDKHLGQRLTEAIAVNLPYYYVGLPCRTHHPKLRELADRLVQKTSNVVPAMSIHHNQRFIPQIVSYMRGRQCFFVKNEHQSLTVFEALGVEIKAENQITVPFKNSYRLYDCLKEKSFAEDAIVVLTCGMLAKIIIPVWFSNNPRTTFIALGSAVDDLIEPWTGKFARYPKGGLPLTGSIWGGKRFTFGQKDECPECWIMKDMPD